MRGSGRKVRLAALPTASASTRMSTFWKFGVKRCVELGVCAPASASQNSRPAASPLLYICMRLPRAFGARFCIPGWCWRSIIESLRLVGDLGQVQGQFLFAVIAHDGDACLRRAVQAVEDLLAAC